MLVPATSSRPSHPPLLNTETPPPTRTSPPLSPCIACHRIAVVLSFAFPVSAIFNTSTPLPHAGLTSLSLSLARGLVILLNFPAGFFLRLFLSLSWARTGCWALFFFVFFSFLPGHLLPVVFFEFLLLLVPFFSSSFNGHNGLRGPITSQGWPWPDDARTDQGRRTCVGAESQPLKLSIHRLRCSRWCSHYLEACRYPRQIHSPHRVSEQRSATVLRSPFAMDVLGQDAHPLCARPPQETQPRDSA